MPTEDLFRNLRQGGINDLKGELAFCSNQQESSPGVQREIDKISHRIDALQRKGLEARKQFGKVVAGNLTHRLKRSQLEDCKTTGLNPSEVIDSANWYTIAEMLLLKKQLKDTCRVSNEGFSPEVNAKLNGQLDRFLEKSREVVSETPFSGLKEHVEGVKSAAN